jgi:hypothetical protein
MLYLSLAAGVLRRILNQLIIANRTINEQPMKMMAKGHSTYTWSLKSEGSLNKVKDKNKLTRVMG